MSLDTEFDPSEGLISPDYEKLDLHLPERAVYAFPKRGLEAISRAAEEN